jgi:hypothetical protein
VQDLLTVAVLLFTLAYPSTTTTNTTSTNSPTMNSVDGSGSGGPTCPTGQKC